MESRLLTSNEINFARRDFLHSCRYYRCSIFDDVNTNWYICLGDFFSFETTWQTMETILTLIRWMEPLIMNYNSLIIAWCEQYIIKTVLCSVFPPLLLRFSLYPSSLTYPFISIFSNYKLILNENRESRSKILVNLCLIYSSTSRL